METSRAFAGLAQGVPPSWPASRDVAWLRRIEALSPRVGALIVTASRLGCLVRQEARGARSFCWRRRLRAWRRGFCVASWVVADLDRNDPREHVSDVVASVIASRCNGSARHLLNDKILFGRLLADRPELIPRIHAVVLDGRIQSGPHGNGVTDLPSLAARLAAGPAILKPACASHGHGIYLLEHDVTGWRLDGRPAASTTVAALLARQRRALIQERIEQHPYAAALYPRTVNTIRVLTMWDPDSGQPFVAAVMQRLGTRASYPADNSYRGGLWAAVDPGSGEVGAWRRYDRRQGRCEILRVHPDTGASLEGVRVPGVGAMLTGLLLMARSLPFLPYVGWDVVITADGFRVLEGNNAPDLAYAGPLWRDARVCRFLGRRPIGLRPD